MFAQQAALLQSRLAFSFLDFFGISYQVFDKILTESGAVIFSLLCLKNHISEQNLSLSSLLSAVVLGKPLNEIQSSKIKTMVHIPLEQVFERPGSGCADGFTFMLCLVHLNDSSL